MEEIVVVYMKEDDIVVYLRDVSKFHTCMLDMEEGMDNELTIVSMQRGLYLYSSKVFKEEPMK